MIKPGTAQAPNALRIQAPIDMADRCLKTRSMLRKRCGRPRSMISKIGERIAPAMAATHMAGRATPTSSRASIDMVKDNRAAGNDRGHPGHSAKEEIERNLPCPNRRFDHGLAVVTRSASRTDSSCGELARNRSALNVDTFARNNALLPGLLTQLFQPLFGWRLVRHF